MPNVEDNQPQTENIRLKSNSDFDIYKAKLDFYKFVLGSVCVTVLVAFIPPSFQYATSILEDARLKNEQSNKQQQHKDQYIQSFLTNGLSQDIELRIRFAQYFSFVSSSESSSSWSKYYDALIKQRTEIRGQIDKMEAEFAVATSAVKPDNTEIDRLERNLKWAYNEIGYAEKNRSAVASPRVAEQLPALPANGSVSPNDFQVFVQFAGVIVRDDIKAMMRKLNDVGWKMRGVELGGERTPAAVGKNEIRYTDKNDANAAEALAQAVQTFNLVSRPILAKPVDGISKGSLEVWISR